MAELSPVPRPHLAAPADAEEQLSRTPTEAEVELVVEGANKLAEIVQRTSMQRISVSMDGVQWTVEAPGHAPVPTMVSAQLPAMHALPAAMTPAAAPAESPAAPAAVEKSRGMPLTSPLVGVFYRSKSPGSPPFVQVGDQVAAGQQVAIVEAMKMMNEVSATRAGVVTEIHVEDGEVVEYGQVLFTVDDSA
jgi:acetyl-CoA carboxylase biotin carboxyl carrier protein